MAQNQDRFPENWEASGRTCPHCEEWPSALAPAWVSATTQRFSQSQQPHSEPSALSTLSIFALKEEQGGTTESSLHHRTKGHLCHRGRHSSLGKSDTTVMLLLTSQAYRKEKRLPGVSFCNTAPVLYHYCPLHRSLPVFLLLRVLGSLQWTLFRVN